MINTAEALRRASGVLGEKGWCQGGLTDSEGRVCAMGALNQAVHELYPVALLTRMDVTSDAVDALVHVVGLTPRRMTDLGYITNPIPQWNDHPARTAEDVILAMKHAAQYVEESSAQADPS